VTTLTVDKAYSRADIGEQDVQAVLAIPARVALGTTGLPAITLLGTKDYGTPHPLMPAEFQNPSSFT
jgi:hypothetical protein